MPVSGKSGCGQQRDRVPRCGRARRCRGWPPRRRTRAGPPVVRLRRHATRRSRPRRRRRRCRSPRRRRGPTPGCRRAAPAPSPSITAPGARGCSDMNASSDEHERDRAPGRARSRRAGFGAPARASVESDAPATSPASSAQNAGTSSSVASVIARHLRCGDSGSMPRDAPSGVESGSRRPRGSQPFTEPAVRPRTKYRCNEKKTTSGSAIVMNAAAVSSCQFSPCDPTRFGSAIVSTRVSWRAAEEHVRDQQVVPHPEELEDRERGQRGHRQRHDQSPEDREVVGAVDLRRLDDRRRQRPDVVAQQIHREREPERRVREPDPEERAVQVRGRGRPCTPPIVAPPMYSRRIGISAICSGTTISPTTSTNIT